MTDTPFKRVGPRVDFPALDHKILKLWEETDAFALSVEQRSAEREYTFYDGPPFPTGSPHFGNLLAGVLKDVVPRYWTMRGYRIERRFGWDTHGLPIEMEVENQLDLNGPTAIGAFGVDRFNEACRALVTENTEVWEQITRRIGRWVDFRNDFKTMDTDFMESVWWVFKTLWDKGLIYQDFKVVPYSFGATTPLSNFEANMDYRDVEDPSITVRLTIVSDHGKATKGDQLLIWTTTPWTLPGNLAIAVGEGVSYSRVQGAIDGKRSVYWLATELVSDYFDDEAEVLASAVGSELIGLNYEPPFQYFAEERDRGAFRVIASPDVNTEEGTGLVHMAPAYGEADFYALQNAGLDVMLDPIDAEAKFTEAVPEVQGQNVKDADSTLIGLLAESGKLVRSARITHSYPFCWRTSTPLIYKAIPTWYVAVEQFKGRMAELNKTIHWVPEHVGANRFGNWLEDARDWAISRNRYWGSCIPVWECDECAERACIGSIDDLEARSGVRLTDLHSHNVDPVTFACTECEGTMIRVPEVLDCWFESGSMPYAQLHYPFENEERFGQRFPADYIAEGLDQTRGWFYTLVVLAAALFDEVPFKNCVVNGLILAEDGRKMSKSLRNYEDPYDVIGLHGADALRAFLINSPVMRGETLRFSEAGVRDVVRSVMLPLWNAYSFFTTYAEADGITPSDLTTAPPPQDRPEVDRWILSVLQSLIKLVNDQMEGYYLFAVVPPMLAFIDDLTNWYIRRSRRRFWRTRGDDDTDKLAAFATLYEVLVTFSKVAAPLLPFVTEELYQGLVHDSDAPISVHLTDYPEADEDLIDVALETEMATVRTAVNLGRGLRVTEGLRVRQPLSKLTLVARDPKLRDAMAGHSSLIAEELNVKEVAVADHEDELVHLTAKADFKALGPRLGNKVKDVATAIADISEAQVAQLLDGDTLEIGGETITAGDVVVERTPRSGQVVASEGAVTVVLDCTLTPELETEGLAREIVNKVQTQRRDLEFDVSDRISLQWSSADEQIRRAFVDFGDFIAGEVLAVEVTEAEGGEAFDLAGRSLALEVQRASSP
ncbi:MAG: isoleucine--tRNA ligase [Acidimicrobiia bacterium]|nr:isoleucine--tRNA ligase [Acidimicrobiia bacterium]